MLHVKYIHILGFTVLLKDLRWKFFTVLLVEKQGEYYSALIFSFSSGLQIIFHSLYFLRHVSLLNLFLKAMAFSEPTLPFKSAVQEYMDIMLYQNYDVHNGVIQFAKTMFMHQMHLPLSTQITITLLLSKFFLSELSKL